MKKGMTITTVGEIIIAIVALALLLWFFNKLVPAGGEVVQNLIEQVKNLACEKIIIVNMLC